MSRRWWTFVWIAALGAVAATYAVEDLTAEVKDAVLSTFRLTAGSSDVRRDEAGALEFVSYQPSLCCEPFIDGLRMLALPAWIGGIPMAVIAVVLLRVRGRMRTFVGRLVARVGFVLQLFSIFLWTVLFVSLVAPSDVILEFEGRGWLIATAFSAIWLLHTLIGGIGARAWWRLAADHSGPIRLLTLSGK